MRCLPAWRRSGRCVSKAVTLRRVNWPWPGGDVPARLPDKLRAAARGDWRVRTACLSAIGVVARDEFIASSIVGAVARKVPGLSRLSHVAGPHGRDVRGTIANGLVDRTWPVRVAAALALGDCRSTKSIDALRQLLSAPFRAERIAAASAIVACGGEVPGATSLLGGSAAVPPFVGDRV